MREGLRLLYGCTAGFTDVVLLYLIAITASLGDSREQALFLFPVWLAAVLIGVAFNRLLFRRGIPIPALAAVNAGLLAAVLFVLFQTARALSGFIGCFLGVCLPVIALGRTIYHAWKAPILQAQLTRLDGALACAAWALLLSQGTASSQAEHSLGSLLLYLPAVVLLNVVCAVALRVYGQDGEATPLLGAPVRGALFAGGTAAVLILLALLLTRLLGGGSRAAVSGFFQAVKTGWLAIWGGVESFFAWLISLLPGQAPADASLPPSQPAASAPPPDLSGEAMIPLLPVFVIIGVIFIAAALIFLLVKLRRVRLRLTVLPSIPATDGKAVRAKVPGALSRRRKALIDALAFRLLALRRRNTAPGLLVWLEDWGRRHKRPRGRGEPIRAYLLRLDGALLPLADALDARYYGFGDGDLTPAQCRRLRRAFRSARRQEARRTKAPEGARE